MKKSIFAVVLLPLVVVGAYFSCGLLASRNYEVAIVELQKNFPGHIESSFQQGLFTSELDIRLEIPTANATPQGPQAIATRIHQTIQHGPFILGNKGQATPFYTPVQLYSHGTLEVEPFTADEPALLSELRSLATTEITIVAPLTGPARISLTNKPEVKSVAMGTSSLTLDWQGFEATMTAATSNLLTYDLDFRAPGLKVTSADIGELTITEMTAQARMQEGKHKLSLGTMTSSMQSLAASFGPGEDDQVSINGLHIRIASSEEGDLLQVEEEISIEKLQVADKQYQQANFHIELANLDAQAIAKLSEAYQAMRTSPAGGSPEMMAMSLLSNHATALLAKSPEIQITNLSLASPEGACQADAKIRFNGQGQVILNPFFLLGRLSAQANFVADERFLAVQAKYLASQNLCQEGNDSTCDQEAARASNKQLQSLVAQNILQLKNGKYSLTASFQDGQTMLNGHPVPLSF